MKKIAAIAAAGALALCLAEHAEMMTRSEMFAKSEDNQVQRTA